MYTVRRSGKQTGRRSGKQTGRQTDRQTDRQADRLRYNRVNWRTIKSLVCSWRPKPNHNWTGTRAELDWHSYRRELIQLIKTLICVAQARNRTSPCVWWPSSPQHRYVYHQCVAFSWMSCRISWQGGLILPKTTTSTYLTAYRSNGQVVYREKKNQNVWPWNEG